MSKRKEQIDAMIDFQFENLQGIEDTDGKEYKDQVKDFIELIKLGQSEEDMNIRNEELKLKEKSEKRNFWLKIVDYGLKGVTTIGTVIFLGKVLTYMQYYDSENPGTSTAKGMLKVVLTEGYRKVL